VGDQHVASAVALWEVLLALLQQDQETIHKAW
jgi:hypothetical protein